MASIRIVAQAMETVASWCMSSLLLACLGGGVLPLAVLLGEKLVGVMAGPALSTSCWMGTLSSFPVAGIRVYGLSPQVKVRIKNAPYHWGPKLGLCCIQGVGRALGGPPRSKLLAPHSSYALL